MQLGRTTLLNIASQKAPTWGYEFEQEPPLNSLNLSYEYPGASPRFAERVGVYHGSELPYVFGQATSLPGHTQGDDNVALAMINAWISFAYYLSPNKGRGEIRRTIIGVTALGFGLTSCRFEQALLANLFFERFWTIDDI